MFVRELTPEDDRLYPAFDRRLTDEDRRSRFFSAMRSISATRIHDLTHFDRRSGAALVALDAPGEMLGVARLHDVGADEAEFAVLIRSDVKGQGLGRALLTRIVELGREDGVRVVTGLILRDNGCMIRLARELGFTIATSADEPGVVVARIEFPSALVERRIAASGTFMGLSTAA